MRHALITFGNEESYGLLFVGGELLEHHQLIRYFDGEDNDVIENILKWTPDFIMFSPMTTFYNYAIAISNAIKNHIPNVVSVFGGHHAMSVPDIVQLDAIDIVVVGPVRGSIEKILNGSVGVIKTTLTEPSDLSIPARHEYYRDIPRMAYRYRKFVLSIFGCPWNCAYCSSSCRHMRELFGVDAHSRYYLNRRPISAVIAELETIMQYDTKEIEWVDDDVFVGNEDWMIEFLLEYKYKVNLPMYVSSTSVSILHASDKLLNAMKGIISAVGLGVQAGRPESLKLFNRQWDNESKMKAAYDRLTSFGFSVNLQFIIGLPVKDPIEDAIDTIKCVQRIGAGSVCSCYPLMIYPTTELERYCIDSKIELNDMCNGDTNSGITGIKFDYVTNKRLKNICKLATLFVKYNVDEHWIRAMLDIDFNNVTSKKLSEARYKDCVVDRLKLDGESIFSKVISETKLRY